MEWDYSIPYKTEDSCRFFLPKKESKKNKPFPSWINNGLHFFVSYKTSFSVPSEQRVPLDNFDPGITLTQGY